MIAFKTTTSRPHAIVYCHISVISASIPQTSVRATSLPKSTRSALIACNTILHSLLTTTPPSLRNFPNNRSALRFVTLKIYCRRMLCADISFTVGPIANLKGHYFHLSLSVCLCVCVSLTGTSTLHYHHPLGRGPAYSGPYAEAFYSRPIALILGGEEFRLMMYASVCVTVG